MSHFYGYLWGSRGTVTRQGHKTEGINARLKSWTNDINISLVDVNGKDKLIINMPKGLKIEVNKR